MFYILIVGSFAVFLGVKCEVQIQLTSPKQNMNKWDLEKIFFLKARHYVELHIIPFGMTQKQCLEGNS